ncbi:MAG: hypothetical protein WCF62_23120 [Pseudolabrys sp.]
MMNALQTGAENFTPTDNSEEGTNLLVLQAQQQSSITALFLAAQTDQNVVRLPRNQMQLVLREMQ